MELVFSICGILIALSASIATIWQGVLMRKHNRLSIKPLLRIDTFILADQPPTISIVNDGVGPAIIESIEIFFDGNEIINDSMQHKMLSLTEQLHFDVEQSKIFAIKKGEVFGTGSHWLFEFTPSPQTISQSAIISERFSKVKFKIKYKSIYSESFSDYFELG